MVKKNAYGEEARVEFQPSGATLSDMEFCFSANFVTQTLLFGT